LTSLVEFQTLYNGILYKNYSRRAACFYTRENKSRSSTFIYTKHLARPLANFAPVISQMKGVKCPTVRECFRVKFPPMQDKPLVKSRGFARGGDDRSWN
jgi:hypothetical protein